MGLFSWIKSKKNNQPMDPYDAPDLVEHRNDPENINLGRQSVSFVGGHGGLTVDYYALLHQVVSHSYSVKDGGKRTSNVNRMNIPENITSKEEIIEYLKANGFAEVFVCER